MESPAPPASVSVPEGKADTHAAMDETPTSLQQEQTAPPPLDWKIAMFVGGSTPGEYAVENQPQLSERLRRELARSSNFLKSAKWSPDGTCLLTTSEDSIARLLELPSSLEAPFNMRCAVRSRESETIYDSAWLPSMNSNMPATCLFATCARDHPVHLWDAFTGRLAASYTALNPVAELDVAFAVSFSLDSSTLYAAYAQRLCSFATERPGLEPQSVSTRSSLPGMLSCLCTAPPSISHETLLAVGTYGGRIGVFSADGTMAASVAAQAPGVTQVMFSNDGLSLYSSGRKSDKILAWDMRRLDSPLFSFVRPLTTQQRLSFALHPTSKVLMTGDEEGKLRIYDTTTGEMLTSISIHCSCINSVAIHPWLPLVGLGTGARRFDLPDSDDEADSSKDEGKQDERRKRQEERVQLWRIGA